MNAENRKIVQEAVREAGDYLKDKLPALPQHQVRNSYAHLWRSIKEKMGKTYGDCNDDDLSVILAIVAKHRSEHT